MCIFVVCLLKLFIVGVDSVFIESVSDNDGSCRENTAVLEQSVHSLCAFLKTLLYLFLVVYFLLSNELCVNCSTRVVKKCCLNKLVSCKII